MAWTAPRTWVSGETLTAALLNTHLRDNILETAPAKVATAGDTVYATGANAITRLALGAAGSVLVSGASAPRWSSTGVTAAAGSALNATISNTLTAAANNDYMEQARVIGTFARGAFTGLTAVGLRVWGDAMSATGAGTIAAAYGVYLSAPTIGATNWALYINDGNVRLGGTSSSVYIGDTSNATATTSNLTINVGTPAGETEPFSLKSNDVAHGMTAITETDTFGCLREYSRTQGGIHVMGFSESVVGAAMRAMISTATTTKATTSAGAMVFSGATYSAGYASLGANANIAVFQDYATTRFILDSDGDSHQDVGTAWTNFDNHDDAGLLTALSVNVSRADDPIRETFRGFLGQHRAELQAAKLVTFNDDGHHFVNMSKLTMLLTGAVRQLADKLQAVNEKMAILEGKLTLLEG